MFIFEQKKVKVSGSGGVYSKNIIRIIMCNKRLWLIKLQIYNILKMDNR